METKKIFQEVRDKGPGPQLREIPCVWIKLWCSQGYSLHIFCASGDVHGGEIEIVS